MDRSELDKIMADHALWLAGNGGARANLTRADLTRADLTRAKLADAKLADANLTRANLTRANLARANLAHAYLTRAKLADADLNGANLTGADLTDADLTDADLTDAYLTRAYLTRADLNGANLTDADLAGADLTDADLTDAYLTGFEIPIIPKIDAAILAAIQSVGCSLNMSHWHTCQTTHCRAGWAVHLAGPAGKALEDEIGTSAAAALIYTKSRPGKRVPNFYALTAKALADIELCARESWDADTICGGPKL